MSKTPKKYDDLNADQQEFLEELEKAGATRDQALIATNQLGELAAMHMKLSAMTMNEGLTDQQEDAWTEIERKITAIAREQPGLKGAEFRYDPRGTMAAVQFASGAGNSLTGAWKIPLGDGALKALDANFWQEHASPQQGNADRPRG